MDSLPSDTLLDIFSRVLVEYVLECKLVCKRWLISIRRSGTYFTNIHLCRQINNLYGGGSDNNSIANKLRPSIFFACQSEDFEGPTSLYHGGHITDKISSDEKYSFKKNLKKINHPRMHHELFNHLVGSCNGLICVSIRHHRVVDPIYVFNPITREYVYLPELVVEPSADMSYPFITEEGEVDLLGHVSSGFGYVRSTDEYKIVRIYCPCTVYESHVEVYTLGSGRGWRAKGTTTIRLMERNAVGIFATGAIYWKGAKNVVAFDLADEKFQLLPYPPCMSNYDHDNDTYGLVALGRRLCFFMEKLHLEIWSLMKNRGSDCSGKEDIWCLDLNIDFEGVEVDRKWTWFKPVLLTETGEVILIYYDTVLYCYCSKTKTLKMISDDEEVSTQYFVNVKAVPHVDTFASLEALGEKSKRYLAGGVWEDNNDIEQLKGLVSCNEH